MLSKGLNFATTPATVPSKEVVCGVETAFVDLPQAEDEEIRSSRDYKTI